MYFSSMNRSLLCFRTGFSWPRLGHAGLLPQGSLWSIIQGPQESLAPFEKLMAVIAIHLCRVPKSWDFGLVYLLPDH